MEITQLTALVGALAILASASILTIGSLTLLNALRERLNRRERSVHEIDQDEHGNRTFRVTHPPALVGRRANLGRLLAKYLPSIFCFLYIASAAYFVLVPIMIHVFDGYILLKHDGYYLFFDQPLPYWFVDQSDQRSWGNVFLLAFCMYCAAVVLMLLTLKILVEGAKPNRIGRDFLFNINMLE